MFFLDTGVICYYNSNLLLKEDSKYMIEIEVGEIFGEAETLYESSRIIDVKA